MSIEEDSKAKREDKSARWWTAPIRNMVEEAETLPGKLNVATVLILSGMWTLSLLAVLAEMAFQFKVRWEGLSFEMGGNPLPNALVCLSLLVIWLLVTHFCMKSYLETKTG